jgi:diguanylate cyclase (GGDEF)-like protein/PAS domain S-box-containing protein
MCTATIIEHMFAHAPDVINLPDQLRPAVRRRCRGMLNDRDDRPGHGASQPAGDGGRTASILALLPDGLVVLSDDGRVVEVNDAFRAMTGFAAHDAAVAGPGAELLRAALAECARSGAADRDIVLSRTDGTRFPAIVSAAVVPAPGGAPPAHILTVKDATARVRAERVRSGLRRVGAAVSIGAGVEVVIDRVARELGALTGGAAAGVVRGSGASAIVAASSAGGPAVGAPPPGDPALTAPVRVADEHWGDVAAWSVGDRAPRDDLGGALVTMAGMVASSVVAERLLALEVAGSGADPLVGLPDARAFSELMERESERARRYGRALSLVLVDIDGFRRINETHGQASGDAVLREVAARLGGHVRGSDWVGRTGGDEYAWLLPETTEEAARDAAARLRRALAEEPFPGVGYLTASLGISSSASAEGAADLYRQAEVALHWAKVSGRNRAVLYSFHVAEEVFSRRGAERAEAPSLRAMRALAWAVDAKDPHTHRHSARVADLAVQLATALGWTVTRAAQLREAGLVHDVGKIAVPDRILFKPGPLTAEEYALMCAHADIGSKIVADVLSPEQAAWVRSHHERWDGAGYPDRLTGEEIPEEARLLTLADCWDVIVSSRAYKPSRSADDALEEVRRCSGSQFWPVAVEALERLVAAGAVAAGEADATAPSREGEALVG